MALDRRSFLQLLTSGALAASVPDSIAKALALPANNATGTIADVQHIVFMMQENRSFDHYFGTLRGVRGFGDPRAVKLSTGNSVFYQPAADIAAGYVLPFHPTAKDLGMQFLEDLDHGWQTTHAAWNNGSYDQWVPAKTYITMAHLEREDIPYQYALADAFTVCDAYHASLLGPTDPNRYHMFTGWVGNDGKNGGPVVDNAEAGYSWLTFPEVLEAAGVSWKVYQDIGTGLNAANSWGDSSDPYVGNYGDNSLLYFNQYRNAQPGSALYEKAVTGTNAAVSGTIFDQFRSDCLANKLPSVSWVVAPEAYTEHPNWPANYGAYYVSEILNALTSNPDVWSKTVFIIMYDENDGFFDHIVPPTPPETSAQGLSNVSTANEIFPGTAEYPKGPYGLGVRVPMLVVSPWSKGGWVNSEVFDHTSLIRFVQKRFGTTNAPLTDPNITVWRQAVTGDLTSAFNFATPNNAKVALPSTAAYVPPDAERHNSYIPLPPVVQSLPVQEKGTRSARAVPYVLNVAASVAAGKVTLQFQNAGTKAGVLQVRSGNATQAPRSYTVAANTSLSDVWTFAIATIGGYDLSVYGPNGFFREYKGGLAATAANIQTTLAYDVVNGNVILTATNQGSATCTVQITEAYTNTNLSRVIKPGTSTQRVLDAKKFYGWYDILLTVAEDSTFRQQLAGHLETGKDSVSDPRMPAQ